VNDEVLEGGFGDGAQGGEVLLVVRGLRMAATAGGDGVPAGRVEDGGGVKNHGRSTKDGKCCNDEYNTARVCEFVGALLRLIGVGQS